MAGFSARGSYRIDMLNGPLLGKMVLFALPLAISTVLQQLFNAADIAVVGRFASKQALAAVGSNGATINLLIGLFVGLSVGTNVLIAKFIGQGSTERVQRAVHTSIVVALASGVFLLFLGQAASRPMLEFMEAPHDVIDLATLYLRIYFLGVPFIMLFNFGAAILRSKGDSRRPLYCLFLAGVCNVILNLILVIVFHLGVAGVAIATVVSNVISSSLGMWFLFHEEPLIRLSLSRLRLHAAELREIFSIGAPAGLQGMMFSLSNVAIQTAINSFGSAAVAGSAAALNFEFVTFLLVDAFCQAVTTFTSQNYGAGCEERCKRVFWLGMGSALLLKSSAIALSWMLREPLVAVFTVDAAVLPYAMARLRYVLLWAMVSVPFGVAGAALRGLGHSMVPAVLTVVGTCLFRFVWLWTFFRRWHTFEALMFVYPVSWILTSVMMMAAYFAVRKKAFAPFHQQ